MANAASPVLSSPPHMVRELRQALPRFRQVDWVERIHSTNAGLLDKARTDTRFLARPWLLGAHLQEEGRGRAGRTWQNRAGANLMFSCAFDVFLPLRLLPALSPLAGITACEALRQCLAPEHRPHLTMKWPNDLQWKAAKLAGILVETTRAGTSRLSADHHVAIMGIGINLEDARALSTSLNRQVADWAEVCAGNPGAAALPVHGLASVIAQAWHDAIGELVNSGFEGFPQRHAQVDALAGRHVNVLDNGRIIHAGIACGINALGQLLVRGPDGAVPITVGEVSVRP